MSLAGVIKALKLVVPTLIVIGAVEGLLRITKFAPSGYFDFLQPTAGVGLYPPNETIENYWGRIPYIVETNDLGLRGTGVERDRRKRYARIATIGDSVTDGFFVDNNGTFQHFLQRRLDEAYAETYEVLNAARGGGSIDKGLAILEGVALDLEPEIVILTFVTNDIADLRGKTREQLTGHTIQFHERNVTTAGGAVLWFFTRTAIGELTFRAYWSLFIRKKERGATGGSNLGDRRYTIAGGDDFDKNVEAFSTQFASTDGIVLTNWISRETQSLIDNYLYALDRFSEKCRDNGIVPVFVYFPSYSQVYDPRTPLVIRDMLREACDRLSMPFLDLTDVLRREGRRRVLHLAPVDYHPNPAGYAVIASAIFDFLRDERLVGSRGVSEGRGGR